MQFGLEEVGNETVGLEDGNEALELGKGRVAREGAELEHERRGCDSKLESSTR